MKVETIYQKFIQCNGVTTDSRHCPEGSLFVALKGDNFNGNTFAAKALDSGCRYAIVDEVEYATDERYILVENSLITLQQLAHHHRKTLGTPVIGITGTNGKTTTKELMAAVLSKKFNLLYTEGNLNNHIGVPLTLLRLKNEHELAVIEMGASHPGDIKELSEIAEPDYGLITNVGKAHLQGFGSFEGVIHTKGELYDNLRERGKKVIFLHNDSPHLKAIAHGLKPLLYGTAEGLYVSGNTSGENANLVFHWKNGSEAKEYIVETQLIGAYNLPNALAAIAVGRFFNVNPTDINQALIAYTPKNNRSQLKKTDDNTLIIDAYNANPTSMLASIGNFHRLNVEKKMLILGDMRELGKESNQEHQNIVDYLKECNFENVILVGEQFGATRHHFTHYPDTSALINALQANKPTGRTILIKGSNGIKLSTIVDYL